MEIKGVQKFRCQYMVLVYNPSRPSIGKFVFFSKLRVFPEGQIHVGDRPMLFWKDPHFPWKYQEWKNLSQLPEYPHSRQ